MTLFSVYKNKIKADELFTYLNNAQHYQRPTIKKVVDSMEMELIKLCYIYLKINDKMDVRYPGECFKVYYLHVSEQLGWRRQRWTICCTCVCIIVNVLIL